TLDALRAVMCSLHVEEQFPGAANSNFLLRFLLQKQNTWLAPVLHKRLSGCASYLKNLDIVRPSPHRSTATTKDLLHLLRIPEIILAPNTSNFDTISFVSLSQTDKFFSITYLRLKCLQTDLQKASLATNIKSSLTCSDCDHD
ncbi:hypothetical protein DXG01_001684, partial [Tephrocybe rancida]